MIRILLALTATLWAATARAEIEVQEITSPGGIDAWLVESHEIPFVAVEALFAGGASLDREGKRGAVNLMTALIEEGSGDMTAREFQRELERLAARFSYDVYDDALSVSARFLSENRDESVDLLNQSLTDPAFDETAIERVRSQVLANIRSRAQNPNDIASETFYREAFGNHPYGSDISGTLESVEGLTRDDLVQAFDDTVVRDRIHVAIVGDITPEAAGEMLDEMFEGLPETGPELPEEVEVGIEGGTTVIDFPSPQSVAFFGHEGLERDDPDYFAAYILNEILGGSGRQSILMEEVREKRGLTYGVGTYLVPKEHAELYLGSVSSANDRVAQAIDVIRAEWAEMQENGVTAEQLEEAKTYITGAYPLRFDGNARIAEILVGMQFTGLPADYIETRNAQIEAVTLEEINRVASELLAPEELHFVVVGQPEGLGETN
ncbi:M16 family metallopeptidase [Histidinibacterium aquaticum]|uniref:Insulinase family protein n=1 Tax=Histidinibacterium aquaticum TaxID=2613962 RepID=A0A5J5GDK2_9RHOB|nr:pitrilysin family protein [Histidinibacterium aquaticum]KAA9006040.1 insulinase family protein [Histidinibacterium aquaticum]